MKKLFLAICCLFLSASSFSQTSNAQVAIIPEPVSMTQTTGKFTLPQNIVIEASAQPEVKYVVNFLQNRLSKSTGRQVTQSSSAPAICC
jgi:hexosaminidase